MQQETVYNCESLMVGDLMWIPSKQNLLEKYIKSFANKGHMFCCLTDEPLKGCYNNAKWKWNILVRAVLLRYYLVFIINVNVILNDVYWRGGDLRQTHNITRRYGTFEVKLRPWTRRLHVHRNALLSFVLQRYKSVSIICMPSQISLRILSSCPSLHFK